jgi:sec-independent protein translocase protein TatB
MNFFNIGTAELLLIFVVALIVVGPRRLPEIARSLGKVVNDIRKISKEFTAEMTRELEAPTKELTEVTQGLKAPVKGLTKELTEVTQGLKAPVKELTKELTEVTQGLKAPVKELTKELTEVTQELETPAKELKETTDQNASEKAAQGDQDNG